MKASKVYWLVLSALFAALTIVLGYVSIPVGPVPITLQTFAVVLTALLLPHPFSSLAMSVHLLIKIFQGANPLTTPSFGFLIGFIVTALVIGLYLESHPLETLTGKEALVLFLIALFLPYTVGLPYMIVLLTNVLHVPGSIGLWIYKGMLIFLPFDCVKLALALILAKRVKPLLKSK